VVRVVVVVGGVLVVAVGGVLLVVACCWIRICVSIIFIRVFFPPPSP